MSWRSKGSGKVLLPFGLDYSDVLSTDLSKEKPTLLLPIHGALSESEKSIAKHLIAFSNLLLNGPFYTGSSTDPTTEQSTTAPDGIQRHSDKYKKIKKIGRTIEEHPYQLELFPDELYSVMGISNKQKKKLLSLSSYKADGGLKEFNVNQPEDQTESMLEKLKSMAETLDADPNSNQQNEELEEEDDAEDDFDDDDDDDDYNAEKYFDDGEDDMNDEPDDEAAF